METEGWMPAKEYNTNPAIRWEQSFLKQRRFTQGFKLFCLKTPMQIECYVNEHHI